MRKINRDELRLIIEKTEAAYEAVVRAELSDSGRISRP
jgi:hypothetical protein